MKMKKYIQKIVGRFSFCLGIGIDQLTPEIKTITFWEVSPVYSNFSGNEKYIKPKMFNVKPQPFSVQIKQKQKNK